MSRRKVWSVVSAVVIAGIAGIGMVGVHNTRAAIAEGIGLGLLPPEMQSRPLGKLIRADISRLRELRSELNITPQQKEEIKAVLESHRQDIVTVAKEVCASHRQLGEAVRTEPTDEAAIRKAAQGMAGAIADAALLRAKIRQEIMPKLTAEQREKIDACRKDMQKSVDEALNSAAKP